MEGVWGDIYGTLRSEFADVPDIKIGRAHV